MSFTLHPQLEADTVLVGDLPLCRVLLSGRFSQYPWLILVPRRQGIKEISDLHPNDLPTLWEEVMKVHDALRALTKADKMNVAALGNVVPQLHVHVIARFKTDEAWPKPVWGVGEPKPHPDGGAGMVAEVRRALGPLVVG